MARARCVEASTRCLDSMPASGGIGGVSVFGLAGSWPFEDTGSGLTGCLTAGPPARKAQFACAGWRSRAASRHPARRRDRSRGPRGGIDRRLRGGRYRDNTGAHPARRIRLRDVSRGPAWSGRDSRRISRRSIMSACYRDSRPASPGMFTRWSPSLFLGCRWSWSSLGPFVSSRRCAEAVSVALSRPEAWFREYAGMVETRVTDSGRVAEARNLKAAEISGGGA